MLNGMLNHALRSIPSRQYFRHYIYVVPSFTWVLPLHILLFCHDRVDDNHHDLPKVSIFCLLHVIILQSRPHTSQSSQRHQQRCCIFCEDYCSKFNANGTPLQLYTYCAILHIVCTWCFFNWRPLKVSLDRQPPNLPDTSTFYFFHGGCQSGTLNVFFKINYLPANIMQIHGMSVKKSTLYIKQI